MLLAPKKGRVHALSLYVNYYILWLIITCLGTYIGDKLGKEGASSEENIGFTLSSGGVISTGIQLFQFQE